MVTILNTSNDVFRKVGFSSRVSKALTKWSFLLHIAMPLLLCIYIYSFCRPSGMGIQCIAEFCFGKGILSLHQDGYISTAYLSDWVVYSMPAALWTFSITLLGMVLDIDPKRRVSRVGLIPLSLALGLEFLQFTSLTDGTFDPADILAAVLGYLLAIAYVHSHQKVIINILHLPYRRLLFGGLFACVYVGDVWI